ncbi:hypothetical protein [Pseudidiomarina gelatinasegens]
MHFKLFGFNAFDNLMVQIDIPFGTLTQLLIKEMHTHSTLRFSGIHC